MDKQIEQLLSEDFSRLKAYFQEMSANQGAGVLVVNYYPSEGFMQMEAKFLKASQISRLARQMGLVDLQPQFEQHNPQTQMVVAAIAPDTKSVMTLDLQPAPSQPAESTQPKRKPAAKTATKRSTTSKSTTRRKKQS